MTASRDTFIPQESEELRRFLNEATKGNRGRKNLQECMPVLQVQSLVDMKIHEQMGGSPLNASRRASYIKDSDSDSDSKYDEAEAPPLDHDKDDDTTDTSVITHERTSESRTESHSLKRQSRRRILPRILDIGEDNCINEIQPAQRSPFLNYYLQPNVFSDYLEPPGDADSDHDMTNPFRDTQTPENEISALKFRIVELEYVNAALESKIRKYREEIRLFKRDVRGYKNDGRRFAQQLKDKNMEITALHTKIIQLLNNDTLESTQTVASNTSGVPSRASMVPSQAIAKQGKGGKSGSNELKTGSRSTVHGDDARLNSNPARWFL